MTATLALFFAAAPFGALPQTRVLVDFDSSLDKDVCHLLMAVKEDRLAEDVARNKLVMSVVGGVLVIHPAESPFETYVSRAIALIQGLDLGTLATSTRLDSGTATALAEKVRESFGSTEDGGVPGNLVLRAEAKYQLRIDGRTLAIDLPLDDGSKRSAYVQQLLASPGQMAPIPSGERKPKVGGGPTLIYTNKSRQDPNTLRASSEFLAQVESRAEAARQKLEDAAKEALDAVPDALVPTGFESLDQLPASVRDRLKDSFAASYRAYGFSSPEDALAAWNRVEMTGGGVKFAVEYAVQDPSGKTTLRSVEVGRTGHWN